MHVCMCVLVAHLLPVVAVASCILCNALILFFMVLYVPIQHINTSPSSTTSMATNVARAIGIVGTLTGDEH